MDSVHNALLKVLLVEDDEDDYTITRDLLSEMERFELEWLTDYDDALKAIERKEHDVCLLGNLYTAGVHKNVLDTSDLPYVTPYSPRLNHKM